MSQHYEDDLRLELRARNNRLWHLIFDGFATRRAFCQAYGLAYAHVGALLNLTASPYLDDGGGARPLAAAIATIASVPVEEMFPPELYAELIMRRYALELPSERFKALAHGGVSAPLALPPMQDTVIAQREAREAIERVLITLTSREERILRMRFGLNNRDGSSGAEHTLEEVGESFGVHRERVRQIEAKALRKLRHKMRADRLRPHLESFAKQ